VSSARRKLLNFFSLATARIIGKVLAFVVVAYLAQTLGPEQFGVLSFVQTLLTYGVLVSNFGLKGLGTRNIANSKDDVSRHVNEILSLRLILATAIYATILGVMTVYRDGQYASVFLVFGLSLFCVAGRIDWVFNGIEKMEFTAGAETLRYIVYASLVFVLVDGPSDLLLVGGIYVTSRFVPSIFLLLSWLRATTHRFKLRLGKWQNLLRQAVPIGLVAIFSQLYLNIDIVMTEILLGATAVGWYSAATRIVMAITGIGNLLSVSLFPVLVRTYNDESGDAGRVMNIAVKMLLAGFLPIAVGGTLIAAKLIRAVYGEAYGQSVVPFEILVWAGILMTLIFLFNKFLISVEGERTAMAVSFVGCIVNVILNVPLIGRFGIVGAAIATIVTEIVVFAGVYYYANALVEVRVLTQAIRPFIAAIGMGGTVWLVMEHVSISPVYLTTVVYILTGGVTYFVFLLAVGGIDREELAVVRRAVS
jgi:O-antigen/teichoic acid export membrane protein